MQFIANEKIMSENADTQLVAQAIESLSSEVGNYVILVNTDIPDNGMTFIQTLYDEDGVYLLEYQSGSLDEHYFCGSEISLDDITRVFLLYLSNSPKWQIGLYWEKLNPDEMNIVDSY